LDVQNGLYPTKPSVKACDFAGEPLVLGDERGIRLGLPLAPLGGEAGKCRIVTLLALQRQV
jgi:hypothetical protein